MGSTVSSHLLWLLGSLILILLSNFVTNIFAKRNTVQSTLCKERRDSCTKLIDERHKTLEKKIDYLIVVVDNVLVKKD